MKRYFLKSLYCEIVIIMKSYPICVTLSTNILLSKTDYSILYSLTITRCSITSRFRIARKYWWDVSHNSDSKLCIMNEWMVRICYQSLILKEIWFEPKNHIFCLFRNFKDNILEFIENFKESFSLDGSEALVSDLYTNYNILSVETISRTPRFSMSHILFKNRYLLD